MPGRGPAKTAAVAHDSTSVLNGLAFYKRLLTADERAWLSRNNRQGRAYNRSGIADARAGRFLCGV